jgi:DNA-binding Lrp family transcriptional regulator
MRLQEVLQAVPDLEKRFVHYLESQGYIHPAKLQKARIARRDYSEADLERIRAFWSYYQRGISVQRAYELLTRAAVDGAFVFFPAPARRWAEALDVLRGSDHVAEAAAVYGETANVVARVRAPHESDLHAVLDRLLAQRIIAGLPEIYRFSAAAYWVRGGASPDGGKTMRAWVLIKVPAKQIGGLVDELRSYPGIVEASAIYGETDVIAKVEVPDQDALDELVLQRIQSIDAVDSTRTFIAVGGMHWRRD